MSAHAQHIRAIAADPDCDGPRTACADFLEAQGAAEHAAFIRAQLDHATPAASTRAVRAFDQFGEDWCRALIAAAGDDATSCRLDHYSPSWRAFANGHVTVRPKRSPNDSRGFIAELSFQRGFVAQLILDFSMLPAAPSIAAVFDLEPITELVADFANGQPHTDWRRFTDPCLRRVSRLKLYWRTSEARPAPGTLTACWDDVNLSGVRDLSLACWPLMPTLVPARMPPAVLWDLAHSPLSHQLERLEINGVSAAGAAVLCGAPWRLQSLSLSSMQDDDDTELLGPALPDMLATAGLERSLRELSLHDTDLGDAGLARLADIDWLALTDLALHACELTDSGLHALSAAPFTPRLESLSLNYNGIARAGAELAGLHALALRLDPARLRRLCLSGTGLTAVPDFLRARFGERVTI